ncbi:hypothetical protein GDO81_000066 [Engystomops pustulosus]|uniref:Uncharacterized protein n=1 Tax=Engystomops pustulosus TaxID=76066 RepID=A0AAV7D159_ENGPU|nr:hypothetical protein GDO81_000066 [Engystomops pustulosus]
MGAQRGAEGKERPAAARILVFWLPPFEGYNIFAFPLFGPCDGIFFAGRDAFSSVTILGLVSPIVENFGTFFEVMSRKASILYWIFYFFFFFVFTV